MQQRLTTRQLDQHSSTKQREEVEAIYLESFAAEEREPFAAMWRSRSRQTQDYQQRMVGLFEGGQLLGWTSFAYLPRFHFGYGGYIAIQQARRGQGLGAILFRDMLRRLERLAIQVRNQPLRLVFWEVRDPAESETETERALRWMRIRFYERLGAHLLPVAYACPPLAPGLPLVNYLPMVWMAAPGRALSKAEMLELIQAGLVTLNGAPHGGEAHQEAIRAVEALFQTREETR